MAEYRQNTGYDKIIKDGGGNSSTAKSERAKERSRFDDGRFAPEGAGGGEQNTSDSQLLPYTNEEKSNWEQSKKIVLAVNDEHIKKFISKARNGDASVQGKKLLLGKLRQETADRIRDEVGINLNGYNLELRASDIKHAFNQHSNDGKENLRGQKTITENDIANFAEVETSFDAVKKGSVSNSLTFIKQIDGQVYAITYYADGNKSLALKTMYKK